MSATKQKRKAKREGKKGGGVGHLEYIVPLRYIQLEGSSLQQSKLFKG